MDIFNPYVNINASLQTASVVQKSEAKEKSFNYKPLSPLPENPVVTMAYVPFQASIDETYSETTALNNGTLFPCLDKPFLMGSKVMKK
ncbi:MAG: spore coat associated protein CotJA [Clostridiales bacterium]|nr:spore coat associated protein CotJA [Clostridiales bacterium]